MFRVACAVLGMVLFAASGIAATARVAFDRIHPAPHSLGSASEAVLVSAIGDHESIRVFLDSFLYETNHAGTLQVYDGRNARHMRPGAVPLRIGEYRCTTQRRAGEGSTRDFQGNRVRRRHVWVDAVCEAKVEIIVDGKVDGFRVRGEGTSPRVESLTPEETEIAVEQAAHFAAVAAAEEITPRRVRETVTLDEKAPAFDDGFRMIDADQLERARRLWEGALQHNRDSAALRFNLGALCEAIGDVRAAAVYLNQAHELAPHERRYRDELEMFRRRNRIKK